MVALQSHARLLYLLALFQLVGGPLVLGAFLLGARLLVEKEVPLTQTLSCTLELLAGQEGWSAASADDWLNPNPHQAPRGKDGAPVPPGKDKTPDAKGKLWALGGVDGSVWEARVDAREPCTCPPAAVPMRLANAPPVPPPRLG